jgi:hypothetical protein
MCLSYQRSVWEFDPRWLRIEAVDEHGCSLGTVQFEPNPDYQPSAPRTAAVRRSMIARTYRALATLACRILSDRKSVRGGASAVDLSVGGG